MSLSRRSLFRALGTGVVGAAAVSERSLAEASTDPVDGHSWLLAEARRPGGPIRLHRNENPYGASRDVVAAIQNAARTAPHRFPDVETEALRGAIATLHRVTEDRVVLGCGSSEILQLAASAFVGSRGRLVVASPTFEWFARCAQRPGVELAAVPLTREYAHDLDAMLARARAAATLVYVCNPNNPTGTLTRRQDLEAFLRKLPAATPVVIDEAYHHYVDPSADYASFLDRPLDDPRVIVTRSFSKIHGLAGLRAGYAVAAPETARLLRSYQLPDSVNVVAARAALIALQDEEHVRASRRRTADDRQEFFNQANARMLRAIDSQASFVMLDTGRATAPIVEHFRKHHVVLPPPLRIFEKHIRVSLGTPDEMRMFWRTWDLLPAHHHMSM